MKDSIRQERDGHILTLTINRPTSLNAINKEVMDELHRIFVRKEVDMHEIRVILLTGSGEKAFAAGADISEFPNFDREQGRALSARGHEVYDAIESFPIPVIAVIRGYALGGGCELAMACHLRIAEQGAKLGQPEVNLGIVPGYGGSQRFVNYLGRTKAMEHLLTGDFLDAEEAMAFGLVNEVVPSGEAMKSAHKMAKKIALKSPLVVSRLIELVQTPGKDGFGKEIEFFGRSFESEDLKEGVAAFLEKRQANFIGK